MTRARSFLRFFACSMAVAVATGAIAGAPSKKGQSLLAERSRALGGSRAALMSPANPSLAAALTSLKASGLDAKALAGKPSAALSSALRSAKAGPTLGKSLEVKGLSRAALAPSASANALSTKALKALGAAPKRK